MKKFLVAFALSLPLVGNCTWIDVNGNPIPDTPSMRSRGDFGVQLFLASSEKEFRDRWNSTTETPTLTVISTIKRGESISGVLIFSGCEAGVANACDVTVEFSLQAPDGVITPAGKGPVWTSAPPQTRTLMLGQASISFGFAKDDTIGNYKILADVTDNVAKQTLRLISPFVLTQ